jgi:hypothetical protein
MGITVPSDVLGATPIFHSSFVTVQHEAQKVLSCWRGGIVKIGFILLS